MDVRQVVNNCTSRSFDICALSKEVTFAARFKSCDSNITLLGNESINRESIKSGMTKPPSSGRTRCAKGYFVSNDFTKLALRVSAMMTMFFVVSSSRSMWAIILGRRAFKSTTDCTTCVFCFTAFEDKGATIRRLRKESSCEAKSKFEGINGPIIACVPSHLKFSTACFISALLF